MVVGQKNAPGRAYKHQTVTIDVAEHDLVIHLENGLRVVARTAELPARAVKAHRPRKVESFCLGRL
jgi:hypothetical protein